MANQIRVLLASRAIESPPLEGGFVLLSDLATEFSKDSQIHPTALASSHKKRGSIHTEKVYRRPGWNWRRRIEFLWGLLSKSSHYDIVHTAHIPTATNCLLIKMAIKKARQNGTRFIQTITGLPNTDIKPDQLSNLLWGDWIVCQSGGVLNKVKELREAASLIPTWPAPSRITYKAARRQLTRKQLLPNAKKIVIFPGEFDRLGIDISFANCLEVFFENSPGSIVILACRFDNRGTGQALARQFPGKVSSIGEATALLPLLEAADLTIYPARQMHSKFQPPLVMAESLQLGTPVLASTQIDFDKSIPGITFEDTNQGWEAFGLKMAEQIKHAQPRKLPNSPHFAKMVEAYRQLYLKI